MRRSSRGILATAPGVVEIFLSDLPSLVDVANGVATSISMNRSTTVCASCGWTVLSSCMDGGWTTIQPDPSKADLVSFCPKRVCQDAAEQAKCEAGERWGFPYAPPMREDDDLESSSWMKLLLGNGGGE